MGFSTFLFFEKQRDRPKSGRDKRRGYEGSPGKIQLIKPGSFRTTPQNARRYKYATSLVDVANRCSTERATLRLVFFFFFFKAMLRDEFPTHFPLHTFGISFSLDVKFSI